MDKEGGAKGRTTKSCDLDARSAPVTDQDAPRGWARHAGRWAEAGWVGDGFSITSRGTAVRLGRMSASSGPLSGRHWRAAGRDYVVRTLQILTNFGPSPPHHSAAHTISSRRLVAPLAPLHRAPLPPTSLSSKGPRLGIRRASIFLPTLLAVVITPHSTLHSHDDGQRSRYRVQPRPRQSTSAPSSRLYHYASDTSTFLLVPWSYEPVTPATLLLHVSAVFVVSG